MKCVKCGMELSTQMLRADGALQCPSCGAVYRRKKSTDSSSGVDSSESYPSKQEVQRKETSYETRNSSNQHIRNTVDADQSMNSAVRAKLASVAEKATETKKSIVERGNAHSTAKAIASDEIRNNRHKSHGATIPIILALVVVLGFGIFGYAFSHFIDGNPPSAISSIFKSKDSKEINDLMKRMEKAYNAQDVYALLQLYDPTYTDAMFGMMNLIGLNGDTFKSVLPFASQIISQYNSNSSTDSGKITVKLLDYSVNGTTGTAKYQVDFSFKDGSKDTLTQTADIVKVDDKWYFSYFPSTVGSVATTDNSSVSTDAQPTATGPIPVAAGLTESDVAGDLYYIKGKKADGTDGWGVINAQGKEIIAPYFTGIKVFDGNCFAVTLDGIYWGFIDRNGQLVHDYQYRGVSDPDSQGFYAVYDGKKYGVYNPSTGQSVSCEYDAVGKVNESGLFPAKQQGYWGIMDIDGNIRVNFRYDEISNQISNDLIAVSLNGAWGIVDSHGNEILPITRGRYIIQINNEVGTVFVEDQNSQQEQISNGYYNVLNVYNQDGRLLSSMPFQSYGKLNKGRILLMQNSDIIERMLRYQLLDAYGNVWIDTDQIILQVIDLYFSKHPERADMNYFRDMYLSQIGNTDYLLLTTEVYDLVENEINFLICDLDGVPTTQSFFSSSIRPSAFLSEDGTRLFVTSSDLGNNDTTITRIYSFPDMTLLSEQNYMVRWLEQFGEFFIFQGEYSDTYFLADQNGNVVQRYSSCSLDTLDNSSQSYAFLSDGVYYGVFTDQGFVGKGVAYSKVSCDEETRTIILNDGANQETYRYNPDGTITQLS